MAGTPGTCAHGGSAQAAAPILRGPERGGVHQAVGGEYGVNDQSGLRPKVADVEQTQVGDGGDLLDRGEPVPGEHGVDPGPEQRLSVVERCLGDRQVVQPPSVDPAAQQLTQVLAQLAGADQVHPSIGAPNQEHRIAVVDLTEIGGPPDVGEVAELVGLPRRQHPPERLARVVRVGPAGLVGQRAMDPGAVDVYP
jgi:hypothetical protein